MSAQSISLQQPGKEIRFPMMLILSIVGHVVAFIFFVILPSLLPSHHGEPFGGPAGGGNVIWGQFDTSGPNKIPGLERKQMQMEQPAPPKLISKKQEDE